MIQPTKLSPFKHFCVTIGEIPSSYLESMTYYELLNWFCDYLQNTVIPAVNTNAEAVEEIQTLFIELKNYVDNYFDNLNVQEEINNKLDDMVEQGTLQEIIADYLSSKAIFGFDTVADMKQSNNLIDGSYAETLGYYEKNDGGASLYKIRNKEISDVVNEMELIEINENLVAELVINNQTINIKQFGAYGNGVHDDTSILNYALSLSSDIVKKILLNETYLISSPLLISSNKDIEGIKKDLQYNSYEATIITTSDITMLNLENQSNIYISNINLVHPVTNTSSVVNFSKAKYLKFENIQCYHEGTTKAPCIAFNDTLSESSSGFSGYIEFKNVRANYYENSLKSVATLIDLKNCVFNNANSYNIYFTGEVLGIENCDISYSTSGKAIKTESIYDLNIINSYLEGFYVDSFIEKTNNINVNLKGCKIYLANGVPASSGIRLESTDEYPQPLRNTLNNFQSGNPSSINYVPNGKFDKGTFGWSVNAITEISVKSKSELSSIGIPHYIDHAIMINNGNIFHNFNNLLLNTGDYITLGYWIYIPATSIANPYITISNTSNQNAIINDRPAKRGQWVYHTTYAKITENLKDTPLMLRIAYGETLYITGITLMKGIATSIDYDMNPNDQYVLTDNMIIKGTNNKYYKLVYDGTDLTFTETTTT